MVALRIYVLVSTSTEQFPNKIVFIKTVSVTSSNLQSMSFIVLRRYVFHHGTWGSGECNEKSIQNQNRSCKLDLMYLENYVCICGHAND